MTNVTYTYPTATEPSLYGASASLALSSRFAINGGNGGNGAGKPTLVKLLTGEMVAQKGKVEKHPNLRVGYMAQQSLYNVQMNLEKTPSQYLQWRFSSGTDKEVAMKDTRLLSEADRKQLETPIGLGGGSGPRRIEALVEEELQYETNGQTSCPSTTR
jgi:elongation factor 3